LGVDEDVGKRLQVRDPDGVALRADHAPDLGDDLFGRLGGGAPTRGALDGPVEVAAPVPHHRDHVADAELLQG
jgi:hypothetical protein